MEEKIKSFLDEGFDFIEESVSTLPLEYTQTNGEIITEAQGHEKSPYHILGVCRGIFQPINEPSRNKRIYEADHWGIQLDKPEVQERLKTRSMWGTLGHFDRRISDVDIREGLVSHIITKLEIREDADKKPYLYGELEILDTPAGRILEAMYKGGANLYVSSRGAGKLLNVYGDELKHVDPHSFWFEGFDIVRAPGFLKARPVYESTPSIDNSQHPVQEAKQEPTAAVSVTTESTPCTTANWAPITISDTTVALESTPLHVVSEEVMKSEVSELKGQIDRLAQVIEKVVDDIYEENGEVSEEPQEAPEEPKAPVEEKPAKEETPAEEPVTSETANEELIPESIVEFIKLLAETNITDEAASDIFGMLFNKKEEN